MEGTGAYGAALTRHLRAEHIEVVEVDRPDRKARRAKGKSDPLDAYAAARYALSGSASGTPKLRDGRVEAIRALRVARRSAVKARTQAMNQLRALLLTGPAELGRDADTERQTARAAAGSDDDASTSHVDERREGQNEAQTHTGHAGADHGRATGLLGQADGERVASASGFSGTATAALNYPTPVKAVTAAQAAPTAAPAAPAARTETRRAPTSGRRR